MNMKTAVVKGTRRRKSFIFPLRTSRDRPLTYWEQESERKNWPGNPRKTVKVPEEGDISKTWVKTVGPHRVSFV